MLMLQKKYTAVRFGLSLSLMLLSLTAQSAEPYRLELHGGYSSLTSDDSAYGTVLDPTLGAFAQTSVGETSRHGFAFSGQYYFDPIETSSGPLNEAAFLARSSGLTFYASSLRVRGEAQSDNDTRCAQLGH